MRRSPKCRLIVTIILLQILAHGHLLLAMKGAPEKSGGGDVSEKRTEKGENSGTGSDGSPPKKEVVLRNCLRLARNLGTLLASKPLTLIFSLLKRTDMKRVPPSLVKKPISLSNGPDFEYYMQQEIRNFYEALTPCLQELGTHFPHSKYFPGNFFDPAIVREMRQELVDANIFENFFIFDRTKTPPIMHDKMSVQLKFDKIMRILDGLIVKEEAEKGNPFLTLEGKSGNQVDVGREIAAIRRAINAFVGHLKAELIYGQSEQTFKDLKKDFEANYKEFSKKIASFEESLDKFQIKREKIKKKAQKWKESEILLKLRDEYKKEMKIKDDAYREIATEYVELTEYDYLNNVAHELHLKMALFMDFIRGGWTENEAEFVAKLKFGIWALGEELVKGALDLVVKNSMATKFGIFGIQIPNGILPLHGHLARRLEMPNELIKFELDSIVHAGQSEQEFYKVKTGQIEDGLRQAKIRLNAEMVLLAYERFKFFYKIVEGHGSESGAMEERKMLASELRRDELKLNGKYKELRPHTMLARIPGITFDELLERIMLKGYEFSQAKKQPKMLVEEAAMEEDEAGTS